MCVHDTVPNTQTAKCLFTVIILSNIWRKENLKTEICFLWANRTRTLTLYLNRLTGSLSTVFWRDGTSEESSMGVSGAMSVWWILYGTSVSVFYDLHGDGIMWNNVGGCGGANIELRRPSIKIRFVVERYFGYIYCFSWLTFSSKNAWRT